MTQRFDDSSRKGQILEEGDHCTVVFKRWLAHAPERVWDAITNPEELKHWMMTTFASNDRRVGGIYETVAGPAQFRSKGKILAWEPPRIFEYEWVVTSVKEMPAGENAVFRWYLEPEGSSTALTVTYRRLTRQTARGFAPGTHIFLDRLEAQLAREPLPDWMARFQELIGVYRLWED